MFGSKFLGGNIRGANFLNENFFGGGGGGQNGEQFLFKGNFHGRKF